MKRMKRLSFAALLLSLLIFSGCGADAASMRLTRTEGEVGVSDDAGQSVEPRENLGLYSGYGVNTQSASFAWIDLDSVKLAKLDEKSGIAIQKEDKRLEIEVKSGSLFFNVSQPLEADETMNIRSSTMAVGIRGTCGWVEVPNGGAMKVCLLEGKVECSAGAQTATVSAGEMATMTGSGEITVEEFSVADVPAFVLDELAGDGSLAEAVQEASGIDVRDDPRIAFADVLAELDEENEILYTETVDLEGDGAPELLAVTTDDSHKDKNDGWVRVRVYRDGPEGTVSVGVVSGWMFDDEHYRDGRMSLADSGGRLYVQYHSFYDGDDNRETGGSVFTTEKDEFYGIDGNTGEWIRAEVVDTLWQSYDGMENTFYRRMNDPNGTLGQVATTNQDYTDISPDEYAAILDSYREVKTLVSTQDNASLVIAPNA